MYMMMHKIYIPQESTTICALHWLARKIINDKKGSS